MAAYSSLAINSMLRVLADRTNCGVYATGLRPFVGLSVCKVM